MRVRIENWYETPFRLAVFDMEDGSIVLEAQREVAGRNVVGGWTWKVTPDGQALISGACRLCGCYELRGFGWASSACLPGQFHRWKTT